MGAAEQVETDWAFNVAVTAYRQGRHFDVVGDALRQAKLDLDQLTDLAVKNARRQGESWTSIGAALGMSRQAAQQRFG